MQIFETAAACRRCPEVAGPPVLGPRNGYVPAEVLFVGEAPGRLGAGRTGIPFNGDEAGRRFERLLAEAGLARDEVFVTNAVLCVPLDAARRNRTPRPAELANCLRHLSATIDMVQPRVVVAIGATALGALGRIAGHRLTLRDAVGEAHAWNGHTLVALYHTGQRAQVHRSWAQQVADWQQLGAFVRAGTTSMP